MSKLADEIIAMITGFPKPLDADNAPYSEGFITATIKAAELVEKRESERVERIKAMIEKYKFVYADDYKDGRKDALNAILDMEDA